MQPNHLIDEAIDMRHDKRFDVLTQAHALALGDRCERCMHLGGEVHLDVFARQGHRSGCDQRSKRRLDPRSAAHRQNAGDGRTVRPATAVPACAEERAVQGTHLCMSGCLGFGCNLGRAFGADQFGPDAVPCPLAQVPAPQLAACGLLDSHSLGCAHFSTCREALPEIGFVDARGRGQGFAVWG